MNRSSLVEIASLLLDHVESGTTALHPDGPRRLPASIYRDPDRFALERERIFAREPQLVCLSSDLPAPGDFQTHDDTGVPMLVVRGRDGRVRAFLNACAHRAARLVSGDGRAERELVCPYHAWRYDLEGRCTGIHQSESFGDVSPERFRLIELPCEEKYGLVYAAPSPEAGFSIEAHLGDLGPELEEWDLAKTTYIDARDWRLEANWKLALDTFVEGYHFAPLHKDTIAVRNCTNTMSYDRYGKQGEHHRICFPRKRIVELRDQPEQAWEPLDHFTNVYYLFPNISLLVSGDEVEFFRLFPGRHVGESIVRYRCYMRRPVEGEARWNEARGHFRYIHEVIDREDFRVCRSIQKSLDAGLVSHMHFGQNEPTLINMHRGYCRAVGLPACDEPLAG